MVRKIEEAIDALGLRGLVEHYEEITPEGHYSEGFRFLPDPKVYTQNIYPGVSKASQVNWDVQPMPSFPYAAAYLLFVMPEGAAKNVAELDYSGRVKAILGYRFKHGPLKKGG